MLQRVRAALLLFAVSISAIAQDPSGRPITMPTPGAGITGFVTAVSGNVITLFNGAVTIDVTGAVFYKSRKGEATIADVKPGVQIVAAFKNPNIPLQAAIITILDFPDGSLNGPVQSIDLGGSALTVLGVRVLVTANTRIFGFDRKGGTATLADIKPGDTVAVEVSVNGSTLSAEVIQIFPPMPNTFLEGTVKSIGATSWVITTRSGDVTVIINADTRIDPAVKVGDTVQVSGIADNAGIITALSIYSTKPRPTPPPANTSIEGTVQSIGAASWVITTRGGDITVTITADTKIEPGIVVGDKVVAIIKKDGANVFAVAIMKQPTKMRATRS